MSGSTDSGRRAPIRLLVAAILGVATLFLGLALASYTQTDPSFSTAAGGEVANWMGAPGAYAADGALFLFGAGREKRLYAVPPHTLVEPLEFEDVKFHVENFEDVLCASSGEGDAFLDEIYENQNEGAKFVINDSNFLDKVLEGKRPPQTPHQYWQPKRRL